MQKVFVGPTSEYRTESVKALIDDIQAFSPSAYDVQEQPLSVRCHLLALVLGEPSSPTAQMSEKEAENLMNVLLSLLLSNPGEGGQPVIPKWLSAHLLVVESLLVLGDSPRSLLSLPTLPKDELISVLRLIILLTRDHDIAEAFIKHNDIASLFQ